MNSHKFFSAYVRAKQQGRAFVSFEQITDKKFEPLAVYRHLLNYDSRWPMCLMESATHGKSGRFSFIGFDSIETVSVETVEDLSRFKRLLAKLSPEPHEYLPYVGGAVGGLWNESFCLIEPTVKPNPVDPFRIPKGCSHFFRKCIVFDHEKGVTHFISNVPVNLSSSEAECQGKKECEEMMRIVSDELTGEAHEHVGDEIKTNMTPDEFREMVRTAKRFIEIGDVFQVVLSQRFSVEYRGTGIALYSILREINPSPYMFHMRFGPECRGMCLLGSSPEIMADIRGRKMRLRPIAGTRKRGMSPEEDERLAKELLADPKEQAEHRMLVDLARNDVGRYCEANSVNVLKLMLVEKYSHVMHIASEVQGELRDGVHPLDACLGSSPAGTLSGAPKVRAMQRISELEKSQRGPYGGAFGWFTDLSLDTCIFIRSAMILDGTLHWQTGAGIVYDSDPESEYLETMAKARAILIALQKLKGEA